MHTFDLNGQSVRFFRHAEIIYFVTSDANKAFGFKGQNTLIDKLSVNSDSLVVTDINPISSDKKMPKGMLAIELPELIKAVVKSNNPELENLADVFVQFSAKAFAQNLGMNADRPMLPPVSEDTRLIGLAKLTAKKFLPGDKPKNLIDLIGWLTITETLGEMGYRCDEKQADCHDKSCLVHGGRFRFFINNRMTDAYRSLYDQDPPKVTRKIAGSQVDGCCYPPSLQALIKEYTRTWVAARGEAA